MTRAGLVAVVLPSLALAACSAPAGAEHCARVCEQLEGCALFPNDLGAPVGATTPVMNCTARCEDSRTETAIEVRDCLREVLEGADTSSPSDWCGQSPRCLQAARCIEDRGLRIEREPVRVTLVHGTDFKPECDEATVTCVPSASSARVTIGSLCDELGVLRVILTVDDRTARDTSGRLANYDCEELAANPMVELDLPVGAHDVRADLRVVRFDEEEPVSACWSFRAWTVVPNACGAVAISIPTADQVMHLPERDWLLPCERSLEECHDGVDNDDDGRVNCADASCALHCIELCSGGVDEDEDLRFDCADSDCMDDPECLDGGVAPDAAP